MIFSEEHIRLVLEGKKTQTRRRHVRPVKLGTGIRIVITRAFQQRLGDITEEDAENEGGYSIKEFQRIWEKISEDCDHSEVVWVYEFRVHQPKKRTRIRAF